MAGKCVVPNLAQITRRGAVVPPCEAGPPLTAGGVESGTRNQLVCSFGSGL